MAVQQSPKLPHVGSIPTQRANLRGGVEITDTWHRKVTDGGRFLQPRSFLPDHGRSNYC